jgi:TetR/AcrR family transcriptional regulator, regulator of cefoperazone and chloramphenicol sensitivity
MNRLRRPTQKRAIGSRKRLMQTGARLFAKHGFDATSVRDICLAARANIAAIHYYFGDKQGLYSAVLKESFAEEVSLFPDPSLDAAESPQRFLEEMIFTVISRMQRTKKRPWHADLVRREMSFPSAPFRDFINEITRHDFKLFMKALKAISPKMKEHTLKHAVLCITGQIGAYTSHPPEFLRLCFPGISFSADECRAIAQSITHFVVSGLKAPTTGESSK